MRSGSSNVSLAPMAQPEPADVLSNLLSGLRYHDLSRVEGCRCVAVEWTRPFDGIRMGAALLEESLGGVHGIRMEMEAGADIAQAISSLDRSDPTPLSPNEECFAQSVFASAHGGDGLCLGDYVLRDFDIAVHAPHVVALLKEFRARHRAMARDCLLHSALPRAMRDALLDMTDHGAPMPLIDFLSLRREAGRPLWDVASLCGTHDMLGSRAVGHPAFRRAVLSGSPARQAIREAWPLSTEAHVSRLRGVRARENRAETADTTHPGSYALEAVFRLPPPWVPPTGKWGPFVLLAKMAVPLAIEGGLDLSELLGSGKGDWEGTYDRVAKAANHGGDPTRDRVDTLIAMEAAIRDARDPVHHLSETLLGPLVAASTIGTPHEARDEHELFEIGSHAVEGARSLLHRGRSLPSIIEGSHAWHRIQQGMMEAIVPERQQDWPALFAPASIDGIEIVPVCDLAGLRDEGRKGQGADGAEGLDHCIATRVQEVSAGLSHVLSLRRPLPGGGYERLSTVEVTYRLYRRPADGCPLSVVEHRGRCNSHPSEEARVALDRFMAMVASGEVALSPEALSHTQADPMADAVRCASTQVFEYDFRDGAALARALKAWEPLLPRWLRGLTPETALETMRLRGVPGLAQDPG